MNLSKKLLGSLLFLGLCSVALVSCQQNDIPNGAGNGGTTTTTKDPSKIFDFSTTGSAKLSINYGITGYSIKFAVYAEYPYDADGTLKATLQPIFADVTDANGKFNSSIQLPAAEDSVYLYSDYIGVPTCMKLYKSSGAFTYNSSTFFSSASKSASRTRSMVSGLVPIGNNKGTVGTTADHANVYSLYNTYNTTDYTTSGRRNPTYTIGKNFWIPSNTHVGNLYQTETGADLSSFLSNVQSNLKSADNSEFVSDKDIVVNTTILKQTASGAKVDYVNIDLVLLHISGAYQNAIGYYYYPSDKPANEVTADFIKKLPKFMVFPRITNLIGNTEGNTPNTKIRTRLQFFGSNYDQAGTDQFPAGYTIGWILVPNLYNYGSNQSAGLTDDISTVNSRIINKAGGAFYSNKIANANTTNHCISIYDANSKKTVVGIEDGGNQDYKDALLFVESNVPDAIYDPERPVINPKDDPVETSFTRKGTYAFEDIWPSGGDYDLNDVVVEYATTVKATDGYVTSIEDQYKVVTKKGGATYHNAFGYVINDNYGGTVSSDAAGFVEEEAKQYIVFANANNEIGNTFTITRTIPANTLKASDYVRNYNPFIVVNYEKGAKDRTEVHLPKFAATSWACANDGGDNAFYVEKDGKYPFAIDLDEVIGFDQVSERVTIGGDKEYPLFNQWVADPTNDAYKSWYKYKTGL